MLRVITLAALFGTSQSAAPAYDSVTPIVAMKDYSKPYRTLDCSQCMQAEGKMCGKKDGSSNIAVTGSSNQGHGICCKPDNVTDSHCKSEGDYICSQPINVADNDPKWKPIITGTKNNQMIAYCPLIKPETCGLTGTDHKIAISGTAAKKISLVGDTAIKTKNGNSKTGLYDACYWEFTAAEAAAGTSIQIKVTKLKNVKSYLYGGATRDTAVSSVVMGNAQLVIGQSYYAPSSTGSMLTALPVIGETDTEFEVEYSVIPTPPKSDMVPMIVGIVVGLVLVFIIVCAIMKVRQNKKENTVQVLAQESVDDQPQNAADKTNNDDMNTIELDGTKKAPADK